MCTSQTFYVEDDASSMVSSDSNSILEQTPAAASLHSNYSFSDSSIADLNSNSQGLFYPPRQGSSSSSSSSSSSRSSNLHQYSGSGGNTHFDDEQRGQSNVDSKQQQQSTRSVYRRCHGQIDCYINSFLSRLMKQHYENRTKLVSIIIPMLFAFRTYLDHMLCILTIVIIRYATSRWIAEKNNRECTLTRTTRSVSRNSSSFVQDDRESEMNVNRTMINSSYSTSTSTSTSAPLNQTKVSTSSKKCIINLKGENNDDERDETVERNEDNDDTSTPATALSPVSFIPTGQDESNDEWGHFADFEVDHASGTIDDPFSSITKSMLRRRGHKLSVCKLEQLEEEGEEEDEVIKGNDE